jgi:hypothetical protein
MVGMEGGILQVYPHGSVGTLPFVTMGCGSVGAMAIFESRLKEGMTVCLSVGPPIHVYQLVLINYLSQYYHQFECLES